MPDSNDRGQVSSNDLRNSQFGGGLIDADTVDAERVGGDIYNIHIGQQTVASSNPVQSENQRKRSQQERGSLEKAYTLQSQRVDRIRNAWVIETDPSRKFQYEQQLQSEERTLYKLGDKLNTIEQQLQATKNYAREDNFNQESIYEVDSYSEDPEPHNQNFSKDDSIADLIEKLKKIKPEAIVSSCSTYQEANALVLELWNEATKIAKKTQLSEALFLLEFAIAIAKILNDPVLWLAIDKDLEFIKAKLR
ncbi:hypothetical protein ACWATR_34440 [Nostoc sp. UIC 10890]